jgi:hypothetical protein
MHSNSITTSISFPAGFVPSAKKTGGDRGIERETLDRRQHALPM